MVATPSFATQFSEMGKAMLVAGLALLVATAVLLLSAEHELHRNNIGVQRANGALLQLAEINTLVFGVDYSARGYALTGDQLFLDHENQKQRDLKLDVAELARLADPEQQADIAKLSQLIDRHAAIYADFVKLGPGHAKQMAALITDPAERQKRYDVQNAVNALHGELMADLIQHQALAEKQQHYTLMLTLVIVAIAFLGGIIEVAMKTLVGRRKRFAVV